MAKRKGSTGRTLTADVNSLGLPEVIPSAPTRLGGYVMWLRREGNSLSVIWCQAYGAKGTLDYVSSLKGGEDWEKVDDEVARCGDVTVTCSRLEEVLGYELKGRETEWDVPTPTKEQIERLCLASSVEGEKGRLASPKSNTQQIPRVKKPEGATGIAEIAAEVGVSPRDARAALRKAKEEKPTGGWAWTDDKEIQRIKNLLQGAKK